MRWLMMMRFRGTSLLGMRLGASVSCICSAYVTALFNECQCRDSVRWMSLFLLSRLGLHCLGSPACSFSLYRISDPLLARCWSCSSSSRQQHASPLPLPTATTIYILTEYISTRMNHPHTRPFLSFVHTHSVLTVSKTHAS